LIPVLKNLIKLITDLPKLFLLIFLLGFILEVGIGQIHIVQEYSILGLIIDIQLFIKLVLGMLFMFSKQYPKNCIMLKTSFEGSFNTLGIGNMSRIIFGSGDWWDEDFTGIFFIWGLPANFSSFAPSFAHGFRGSTYVH
jgi:hypothetical protein